MPLNLTEAERMSIRAVYDIERKGLHMADMVIAVSHLTRNIVINRFGVPEDKVVTVHNAVDFSSISDFPRLNDGLTKR